MVGIVIGLSAGLLIRYSSLRKVNQQLERNVAALQKELAAREPEVTPAASTDDEQQRELLRLRNQAAQLRAATNELQQLRTQLAQFRASARTREAANPAASAAAGDLVPREAWGFAGYATPEAAFQSAIFAHSQGDFDTFLASFTGEEAIRTRKRFEGKTPEELAAERQDTAKITGYRILQKDDISPEETVLVIFAAGEGEVMSWTMRKVDAEWKLAGPATDRKKPH